MYALITAAYLCDKLNKIQIIGKGIDNRAGSSVEINPQRSGDTTLNTLTAKVQIRNGKMTGQRKELIKRMLLTGCVLRCEYGSPDAVTYGTLGENHAKGTITPAPGVSTAVSDILELTIKWTE